MNHGAVRPHACLLGGSIRTFFMDNHQSSISWIIKLNEALLLWSTTLEHLANAVVTANPNSYYKVIWSAQMLTFTCVISGSLPLGSWRPEGLCNRRLHKADGKSPEHDWSEKRAIETLLKTTCCMSYPTGNLLYGMINTCRPPESSEGRTLTPFKAQTDAFLLRSVYHMLFSLSSLDVMQAHKNFRILTESRVWTWKVGAMSAAHNSVVMFACVNPLSMCHSASMWRRQRWKGNKLDSLLCFFGHVESETSPKPNPCEPLQACSVALPAKWKQRCALWCRLRGSRSYLCSLITDIQSLLVIILDNLPAAKPHLQCNNQQLWSSLTLPAWHFKCLLYSNLFQLLLLLFFLFVFEWSPIAWHTAEPVCWWGRCGKEGEAAIVIGADET